MDAEDSDDFNQNLESFIAGGDDYDKMRESRVTYSNTTKSQY